MWQASSEEVLPQKIFSNPQLTRYRCIEIPLNVHIIHVDITTIEDSTTWRKRYVFFHVEDAFDIIPPTPDLKICIHVQSGLQKNGTYQIKRVKKFSRGLDTSQRTIKYFTFADGETLVDSYSTLKQEVAKEEQILWIDEELLES